MTSSHRLKSGVSPITEFQKYVLEETSKEWVRRCRRLRKEISYDKLPDGVRIKISAAVAATVLYALRVPKRYNSRAKAHRAPPADKSAGIRTEESL